MTSVYPLIESQDPEIFQSLFQELQRQEDQIELIASENHASPAVLEALGSVLTNKYAEGYPGRRYYGGCEYVDLAEDLARTRLKKLFGAEAANVQPSSGSQANQAALLALAAPGATILAMDLNHGGHLSHGHPKNLSGMIYNFVHYGVSSDAEMIDYAALQQQAEEVRPQVLLAGASAYPRTIDFARLAQIAHSVDALLMVDMAHIAGLVAVGLHPSPVPHADVVTMTTHKTLRGPRGGAIVCKKAWIKKVNSAVFPGMQGGPLMHVIAAKAVAFGEALRPDFKGYQQQVLDNAKAMADSITGRGYSLVSGGTDNHLMLIDLRENSSSGKDAESALGAAGITVNKNTVPGETRSPMVTSGVRIGTPAMTTRGMGIGESRQVGEWIADILDHPTDDARIARIQALVHELCHRFPIYPELGGYRSEGLRA
jgi:glycine hydroxymethyltransferase